MIIDDCDISFLESFFVLVRLEEVPQLNTALVNKLALDFLTSEFLFDIFQSFCFIPNDLPRALKTLNN